MARRTDMQTEASLPSELNARELARWAWRQLTSMRTALLLLLLLALAAVPGSVVPQENIDMMRVSRWQDAHPKLTPIYDKLGLFSVYESPWFAAIYVLLMISLVGCIIPRLGVYARAVRAQPPAAPANLTRLPEHASYTTDASVDEVIAAAQQVLRKRRFRVTASVEEPEETGRLEANVGTVSAERGYLREAGNLLFHLSVLIVLVGFALGNLLGYKGGVITVVGNGFSNNLTQYDEFKPGSLFQTSSLDPFSFTIDNFDVQWITSGPKAGTARKFVSTLTYRESPEGPAKSYDLRVNHPLRIGGTDVFLIGHGYAPVITIRDGEGNIAYSGPTIFLPADQSFRSYGVIKAPDALPESLALDGELYPTFGFTMDRGPYSTFGDALDPLISMSVYRGDLGLDDGKPQSVYVLNRAKIKPLIKPDGRPVRLDLRPGESEKLPDGLGTVTFEGLQRWNKIQISKTPNMWLTLLGVCLALLGVCGSLFIRPRRLWVRAKPATDGSGGTLVEIGGLDRSGNGDVAGEIDAVRDRLQQVMRRHT